MLQVSYSTTDGGGDDARLRRKRETTRLLGDPSYWMVRASPASHLRSTFDCFPRGRCSPLLFLGRGTFIYMFIFLARSLVGYSYEKWAPLATMLAETYFIITILPDARLHQTLLAMPRHRESKVTILGVVGDPYPRHPRQYAKEKMVARL